MRKVFLASLGLLAAAYLVVSCAFGKGQPLKYVKIGTGAQVGVYYTAGLALADLINERTIVHNIDASVEATDGSVFNINALMAGELDFVLAQADRQFQAVNGEGPWDQKPQDKLRFICSLHTEAVTLMAAEDTGVEEIQGLRGRVVNIGTPGSGTHGNAVDCMRLYDMKEDVDYQAEELKASEASMMLQDGRIDAFFYTVGHPNGSITEATNGRRRVRFIPITGVRQLIDRFPYYTVDSIPIEYYPQAANTQDVKTIGMRTILLSTSEMDDETVYQLTKALFDHLDWFRKRHPSFARLKFREMFEAQAAPIHPGAERYFSEIGAL